MSILNDLRDDPIGGGLAITVPALFCSVMLAAWISSIPSSAPRKPTAKLERPPAAWKAAARPRDLLKAASLPIEYWGRPDATYGQAATRRKVPPRAVVVHFTQHKPAVRLIKYQHNGDTKRGGHFGYHFYVDPRGRVYQGAPLTKRTNHVKRPGHKNRKPGRSAFVASANSIGVAMVGGCRAGPRYRCHRETITPAQKAAGFKVIKSILARYNISCRNVWGHGELQSDRHSFEGTMLAQMIRDDCRVMVAGR